MESSGRPGLRWLDLGVTVSCVLGDHDDDEVDEEDELGEEVEELQSGLLDRLAPSAQKVALELMAMSARKRRRGPAADCRDQFVELQ